MPVAELTLNVYRRIPKIIPTSYLNELVQPAAGPKGPGRRAAIGARLLSPCIATPTRHGYPAIAAPPALLIDIRSSRNSRSFPNPKIW
jgi:hypothetical protein